MVSYQEALEIIIAAGKQNILLPEHICVTKIHGRVSAVDINAAIANPPFDNAAMDGFSLKASVLQDADSHPVALAVSGHIAAGELRRFHAPDAGQCYEIMTGAPVPPGCDAVVPVEKTEKSEDGKIIFSARAKVNDNIRRAGSDFKVGDIVLSARTVLEPAHVLALATLGIGNVAVIRKANIALISTGQEIVDSFDSALEYGQIYNSTKPYLIAALSAPEIAIQDIGTVQDDPTVFRKKLESLVEQNVDLCISTGAVSAGVHDFVPAVLKEMGAEIFFHRVAIRPGKPVFFAKFPGNGPFYFGLPGNPAATAAGLRFFVQPLLRAMQGLPTEKPQYAVLRNDYSKGDIPLRFFMRGKCSWNMRGVCEVEVPQRQQSFMVSPFAGLNVWAVIPENISQLQAGDIVEIHQ
ncbi:MAG: molybdopterin molybdotransferase MoeA [Micavibrio sp.]